MARSLSVSVRIASHPFNGNRVCIRDAYTRIPANIVDATSGICIAARGLHITFELRVAGRFAHTAGLVALIMLLT